MPRTTPTPTEIFKGRLQEVFSGTKELGLSELEAIEAFIEEAESLEMRRDELKADQDDAG